jgi:hypothetical protein
MWSSRHSLTEVALNGLSGATYRQKWHRNGAGQGERCGIDIPILIRCSPIREVSGCDLRRILVH